MKYKTYTDPKVELKTLKDIEVCASQEIFKTRLKELAIKWAKEYYMNEKEDPIFFKFHNITEADISEEDLK